MKTFLVVMTLTFIFAGFSNIHAENKLLPPELGVSLQVPPGEIWPGDIFYITVNLNNPTEETIKGIPLFVLLEAGTEWNRPFYLPCPEKGDCVQGEVHYYIIDVPPGASEIEIVPPLTWPGSAGEWSAPMHLFSGMSNPWLTAIFGSVDEIFITFHF